MSDRVRPRPTTGQRLTVEVNTGAGSLPTHTYCRRQLQRWARPVAGLRPGTIIMRTNQSRVPAGAPARARRSTSFGFGHPTVAKALPPNLQKMIFFITKCGKLKSLE